MKTNLPAIAAASLLIALMGVPSISADGPTMTAANPELCTSTISDVKLAFAPFATTAVPLEVAKPNLLMVYWACYSRPAVSNLLNVVTDGLEKVCSGGGSTVVGWTDHIVLLGTPYTVLNGPASSYYTWYNDGSGGYLADGHTRSALDNIEWKVVGTKQVVTWSFADIPMGGRASASSNCLFGLVTSTTSSAYGEPLGIPALSAVLYVSVDGTTCLVPC